MGGTMRLGADPVKIHEGTRAREIFGEAVIYKRHRHRYEVNNMLRRRLEDEGLVAGGTSPDERLVEIVELPDHPFYVASQFHPEFNSRPTRPEPLFRDFVGAAAERAPLAAGARGDGGRGVRRARRCRDSPRGVSSHQEAGTARGRSRSMSWSLKGSYFETCSCDLMCPCNMSFDHGATYDYCRVTLVFNIKEGEIEGTDVDGLAVAVIADTPKVMTEGNWQLGMFVDDRASDEQMEKLGAVFSGQKGGPMEGILPLIGEVLGH